MHQKEAMNFVKSILIMFNCWLLQTHLQSFLDKRMFYHFFSSDSILGNVIIIKFNPLQMFSFVFKYFNLFLTLVELFQTIWIFILQSAFGSVTNWGWLAFHTKIFWFEMTPKVLRQAKGCRPERCDSAAPTSFSATGRRFSVNVMIIT